MHEGVKFFNNKNPRNSGKNKIYKTFSPAARFFFFFFFFFTPTIPPPPSLAYTVHLTNSKILGPVYQYPKRMFIVFTVLLFTVIVLPVYTVRNKVLYCNSCDF